MEALHWLILALTAPAVAAATWLACRGWYGRKLAAALRRVEKCDKARLFANQQTGQARKQVEALQRSLAEQQLVWAEAQSTQRRAKEREQEDARRCARLAMASIEDDETTQPMPASGFADTQPMPP